MSVHNFSLQLLFAIFFGPINNLQYTDYTGDACTNLGLHVKYAVLVSPVNPKWNVLQSLVKSQQISRKSAGLLLGFYKRTCTRADMLKLLLQRFLQLFVLNTP